MNAVYPVTHLHDPADAVAVAVIAFRQVLKGLQLGVGHMVLLLGVV